MTAAEHDFLRSSLDRSRVESLYSNKSVEGELLQSAAYLALLDNADASLLTDDEWTELDRQQRDLTLPGSTAETAQFLSHRALIGRRMEYPPLVWKASTARLCSGAKCWSDVVVGSVVSRSDQLHDLGKLLVFAQLYDESSLLEAVAARELSEAYRALLNAYSRQDEGAELAKVLSRLQIIWPAHFPVTEEWWQTMVATHKHWQQAHRSRGSHFIEAPYWLRLRAHMAICRSGGLEQDPSGRWRLKTPTRRTNVGGIVAPVRNKVLP